MNDSCLKHVSVPEIPGMSLQNISHFLVNIEFAENFSGVEKVLALKDPAGSHMSIRCPRAAFACSFEHVLLPVVGGKWQIENESQPVSIDQEEEGQEGVNSSFGDDIGIQTVAEIDRVDVVAEQQD